MKHPTALSVPLSVVVLAAGLGSRLRAEHPKGLTRVEGVSLIERSLTLLQANHVGEIVMVVGWKQQRYRDYLAEFFPQVRVVENPDYATTGSLASLVLGARATSGDVLVVESDLLYEKRALTHLMNAPASDTLLASGYTQSADEVWVYAHEELLAHLSKTDWSGAPRVGELVGLTRLSREAIERLTAVAATLSATAHYEDGLNAICSEHPIAVGKVDDLEWCEIDTVEHLRRAREQVWPRIKLSDQLHAETS